MILTFGFDNKSMIALDRMTESLNKATELLEKNPNDIESITKLLKSNTKVLVTILKTGIISKRKEGYTVSRKKKTKK
ncbi:hypothetical protein KAR91_26455 [Candidatus Pacearchaeota archaeon]|nr:hypothetical protein [Candidatus Pacearchaeota archaeon]